MSREELGTPTVGVPASAPVILPGTGDASVEPSPRRHRRQRPRVLRSVGGTLGLSWLLLLVLVAVLAPVVATSSPTAQDLGNPFAGISAQHWLGTDDLGRDVFSRLVYGARVSIWVTVEVLVLALLGAIPLGLLAGYRGGRADLVVMRFMDAGLSFPPLVLALAVVSVLGPGVNNAALALAIVFMPSLARLVRAQTLAVREESFVEASRAIGTHPLMIALRRVLPNVAPALVVQAALVMSGTLIAEAALSFLGLGAQPPTPSWGGMLQEAYATGLFIRPVAMVIPGAAIAITVLAFNAVGDALTDEARPDRRGRRRGRLRRGLMAVDRQLVPGKGGAPSRAATADDAVLAVRGLTVCLETDEGRVPVVEDVDLTVARGEILGLVGESGSGKTVTSLSIMRLAPSPPFIVTAGEIVLGDQDLLALDFAETRAVRGRDIAMVFQDPMSSLNPALTVGHQIAESIRLHRDVSRDEARRRAVELLAKVQVPDPASRARSYPHQLSGGMRQRVMIAMALSCGPQVIIADEPTTALDVTVQAQILDLLRNLARSEGLGVVFVTHDLAVVSELCDRVAVMYAGQVVETAATSALFAAPQHPYTAALIASSRSASLEAPRAIPGMVPRLQEMPSGCRFAPRCRHAEERCVNAPQVLDHLDDDRTVRCRRVEELELRGVR